MTVTELPPGLRGWGDSLSGLTAELSRGIAPMLHALDDLFRRRDAGSADQGSIDGYDGFATRGIPDRILLSEWLLADEVPLEFLRRAAERELLHLAPAHIKPVSQGRVVVLVDSGISQLGACRVAQVAALVVLHRRAISRNGELTIGVLGEPADSWISGDLGDVLQKWRTLRLRADPTSADVEARVETLEKSDEFWVVGGTELARSLPARAHMLELSEGAWGPDGVTELHAQLAHDRIELPLPSTELSIRALRGSEFKSSGPAVTKSASGVMRSPAFNSASPKLLMRGEDDGEILYVPIRRAVDEHSNPTIKHYKFNGQVLAAAHVGKPLIALVRRHGEVFVEVIGKRPGTVPQTFEPLDLEISNAEAQQMIDNGLQPLFIDRGILFQVNGAWKRAEAVGQVRRDPIVAIGPSVGPHHAHVLWQSEDGLRDYRSWLKLPAPAVAGLASEEWIAGTSDGKTWFLAKYDERRTFETHGDVIGMVVIDDEPHIVTVSDAGLIVRLFCGYSLPRTLTRWSAGISRPTVNGRNGLIAVQRSEDLIEVGDLATGRVRQVIRSDA